MLFALNSMKKDIKTFFIILIVSAPILWMQNAQKMNKYEENGKIIVYNERKKKSNKISNLDIREELRMKIK